MHAYLSPKSGSIVCIFYFICFTSFFLRFPPAVRREGSTPQQTLEIFNNLFIDLVREKVRCVHLVFFGPNIASELNDSRHSCHANVYSGDNDNTDSNTSSCIISTGDHPLPGACPLAVHLRYHAALYHDFSDYADEFLTPSIMFLFNAGLWGYDDWIPTLEHILVSPAERPKWPLLAAMVVTSYCAEEAEDDMEVVERLLGRRGRGLQYESDDENAAVPSESPIADVRWLWRPEVNPYRSLVERESACSPAGRRLFENHSWQGIRPPRHDRTEYRCGAV